MSTQGLAFDNLIDVELVTADGKVVEVSDSSNPDLMWGCAEAAATSASPCSVQCVRLPTVMGGLIAHPIDAAADLLRFYRDAVADCPDELTAFAGLVHAPDGSGMKLAAMIVCHTDPERADADLAPYLEFGSPLVVEVGPMPYPAMDTILDDGFPAGALNYWLSSFTAGLSDELIDTMVTGSRPCRRSCRRSSSSTSTARSPASTPPRRRCRTATPGLQPVLPLADQVDSRPTRWRTLQ